MALDATAGKDERRLGAILVEQRLLNAQQLQALLGSQRRAAAEAAEEAAGREHPVSEEQRDSIRRTLEAAARKQAERKERASTSRLPLPGPVSRLRVRHLVAVAAVALAVWVGLSLRPTPEPQQVLADYLASCHEDHPAPDHGLAVRDLGFDVRSFGEIALGEAVSHDYADELKAFARTKRGTTWGHLLRQIGMPEAKRRALGIAAPGLPESLVPRATEALTITVRPATVALVAKPRGIGTFREARCRFLLVDIHHARWHSGWKVGDYEQLAAADAGN
jgi:hypothetical protein